jgi:LDH2 family malate/lactate/ureidoglycolate dehydrogenase
MPHFAPADLDALAIGALLAVGTHPDDARAVVDSLIEGNLTGHDSHGIIRLPMYVGDAEEGLVQAASRAEVVGTRGGTAIVDGHIGYGQPAFWLATRTAIDLARANGISCVAVRNSYHVGRVAPYVEEIARNGMVGIAMANAAPAVAPYGSAGRVMGTNPIAWAAPRAAGAHPLSHDIATAAIAEGKLRVARAKGAQVAPGLIVDSAGNPTTDPNDFYDGGAILAFGGHKGSGLSLLAQILGRGLAGMDPSTYDGPRGVNGPVVIAIDIACFTALETFMAQTELQIDAVEGSRPASGVDEVLLPGTPELRNRAARETTGIPLADSTVADLVALAARHGLAAPQPLG